MERIENTLEREKLLKAMNGCIEWIRDFFEKNGKGCNAVLGISGGKDSSVVYFLQGRDVDAETPLKRLQVCN